MMRYQDMKEAAAKGLSFEKFWQLSGLPEYQFIKGMDGKVWRVPMREDLRLVYDALKKRSS